MTTRVRILQAVSGLDFSWAPGEIVDMDDEVAAGWADGYRAEFADQQPPPPPPGGDQNPAGTDPAPGPAAGPDPFDPGARTVKDVLAYLDTASAAETQRVLDAEQAGQARKGISAQTEDLLAAARERDSAAAAAGEGPAEVAADASRGGGRGEQPETR